MGNTTSANVNTLPPTTRYRINKLGGPPHQHSSTKILRINEQLEPDRDDANQHDDQHDDVDQHEEEKEAKTMPDELKRLGLKTPEIKAITDEEFESLVDVYDLTDQELVGVGFNKLGVRKKMLRIFQKAKAEMEIGVIANNSNAAQSQSQSQEAQAQGLDPNWSVVYYRGKNRTIYLVKPSSDSVSKNM
eukprot:1151540_1